MVTTISGGGEQTAAGDTPTHHTDLFNVKCVWLCVSGTTDEDKLTNHLHYHNDEDDNDKDDDNNDCDGVDSNSDADSIRIFLI